jgi:MFS family permease
VTAAAGVRRQHYNITLAALVLAATAYALQQTMVLPALPELQRDLHTTTTWTTWIFTGFLLSSAVLTPLLGKLGDQHERSDCWRSAWPSSSSAASARLRRGTSGR